jgi:UPF0716 family protein affecting phage T7 exclusion
MPLIFLTLLIALPVLDIYATLRFAETLSVPAIALFIPGLIFGVMIMKRETSSFKARFLGAIQSMSVHTTVFDSGRRLMAALLLLAPGFISDVFALFLLMIPNRSFAAQTAAAGGAHETTSPPPARRRESSTRGKDAAVVDGEYRRVE